MTEVTETPRSTGAGSWLRWVAATGFGLLYAFAIFIALYDLIAYNGAVGAGAARPLTGLGWFVMLLPAIFAALTFIGIFVFGRRLRVWKLSLVFLTGLTVVAVFWFNVLLLQMNGSGLLA